MWTALARSPELLLDSYKLMQIQIIKIGQMKNEIQHSHCLML